MEMELYNPCISESLKEKLAKIAANSSVSKDSIISTEDRFTKFPLEALLIIYSKAYHACYIDYMEGFKLLRYWLSPIVSAIHHDEALANNNPLLVSYEVGKIARILDIDESLVLHTLIKISRELKTL